MNLSLRKKLDKEWSLKVRTRDGFKCQICGKKGNQPMHIIPRMFFDTRWELWNGLTGCFSCHIANKYSCHKNPIWFYNWLKNNRPDLLSKAESYLLKKYKEVYNERKNIHNRNRR
jgi:5-methylcytosine-specific restriction endonuclease McrA